MMDFSAVKKDLLIALRGKRSQLQVSKKLGFRYNHVYRWETGKAQMSWANFVRYCQVCNAPLKSAMKRIFDYENALDDTKKLFLHFGGKNPQKWLAERLGISRHAVGRWMNGTKNPTVEEMLQLMDFGSAELFKLLEEITRGAKLPSVQNQLDEEHRLLRLYMEHPWLSIVLCVLSLDEYKKLSAHSDAFVQKKTGLPLNIVSETMRALENAGILKRSGRIFQVQPSKFSLRGSLEMRKRVSLFINQVLLSGIGAQFGSPLQRNSFKMFTMRRDQYDKLIEKYTAFFNDMASIINSGQEGCDEIYVFAMNLQPISQTPPEQIKFATEMCFSKS